MHSPAVLRTLLGVVGLVAISLLVFAHLDRFPRLFFDEGSYLKVAKNLARHGLYAESNRDGPLYYAGPVGIGPTIHVPVALSFLLLGPGVVQGRLVITLYLLGAIALFYLLARRLGGTRLACAATVLLVFTPSVSLIPLGRQVMGETPGFFFIVAALALWFRNWGSQSTGALIAAGGLFALAAMSKNQYSLIVDLSLATCALLNAIYYRLVPHRVFLVPLALTVVAHVSWSLALLYLIIPEGRSEILASGPYVAAVATMILPPFRKGFAAFAELIRPGAFFCLLLPALAYGVHRARQRTLHEQTWSVVLVVVLANLAWFVALSVGWTRYIFVALGLSSLLVARLLARISGDFRLRFPAGGAAGRATRLAPALGAVVLAWVALGVGLSAARLARNIAVPPPDDASAIASYLDAEVPRDATIETWEPEMGFLSDHRFHFPPSALMAEAIAHTHFAAPPPFASYDPFAADPPRYLLVGEFSTYSGAYDLDEVHRRYRRLQSFGVYQLFERGPSP